MKERKKRKLSTKLIIMLLAYGMLNLIFVSLFVGIDYAYSEKRNITELACGHARSASKFIDGDRVLDYLEVVGTDENGETTYYTDDYSDTVMSFLTSTQSETQYLKYYYIFVPGEDGIVYIWDIYTDDEHYSPRGLYEDYSSEAEKEAIMTAFYQEPSENEILVEDETKWGNLATAYYPIYNSDGDPVAVVGADLSMESIKDAFFHSFALIVNAILIVTITTCGIAFVMIKKRLIRPIEQLNGATQDLVGELDSGKQFDLEIQTGDELEELAGSFRKMYSDLRDYLDRLSNVTTERERIHVEFDIARSIQESIIPHEYPAFPERNDFDIFAAINPCEGIGGDFYDFFLIDNDHLVMVMGDVCERGVPGALYSVMVQTLIKNRAVQGFSPAEVLQSISEQMLENKMEMFSSIWLAILDLSNGKGIAANAGHQHPTLRHDGKRFELQKYPHSPPVGAIEGVRFRDHGFQLEPGDTLFIYSDGVRDAMNAAGEPFGTERLLQALNWDPEATPSVLLQTAKSAIERYADGTEQADDLGMMSMKYYGPGGGTQ